MSRDFITSRSKNISPFIVMEVLEKAQQMEKSGETIIHLEVGEPDYPTPEPVKEAAARALRENDTHYTHSLGKIELREEIAAYYWKKYRVEVSPEQIIVCSGTSPGMLLTFSVILEQGEEIILSDPYYACYPNFVNYLDGKTVLIPVYEENGFKYQPDEIKDNMGPSTRAIILNSPANPTGIVSSAADMQKIANLGQTIVSDEIYNGLIYDGEEHTILEFTRDAFVINGFSKLYAMTGWRLGYVIVPPQFIRPMQKLQQNLFICASSFAQAAGISALRECEGHVEDMVAVYDHRRKYLLGRLKEMGIATLVEPTGAFYALANIKEYTNDSYSFAFDLLNEAMVAVTPGIDFGDNCEGYIRLSYANSLDNIKEGLNRLQNFLIMYRNKI